MKIQDHWLTGDNIERAETPNVGGKFEPRYLIMHYTAGTSAGSSVAWLRNPDARASAHVVVARDGTITQLAPFDVVTWHAGVSEWRGTTGLNRHSIGIEMDNAGQLTESGGGYRTHLGRTIPREDVRVATHKHGGGPQPWHVYTPEQLERVFELATLLVHTYKLEDVLGHDDIARGRKIDPGPAFPLDQLRAKLAGRQADDTAYVVVTATQLNVRSGPGVEYGTVCAPLTQGTRVHLLEAGSRWSRIECLEHDAEGWVSNRFITGV